LTFDLPAGFPRDADVLVCDLDRTLIAEDFVLRPRTRAAIRQARAAGIRVLVVTGRIFQSVRRYLEEAGIDDPVVCYQGAVVAESRSGRFLRHDPIPLELAKETIAAVDEARVPLYCYLDDKVYVARSTAELRRYAAHEHLAVHPVGDLVAWLARAPTKLVAVAAPQILDALEPHVKHHFAGRLSIAKSLPYFLEFTRAGITKRSGIAFLARHLGFTADRAVACGDGENDLGVLEWAGYAVAVANAHERVLAVADWVCPPAAEEGVAQMIEALLASRTGGR
jgi:Cof subfamily protein (haloacid dehalogenase superfamily)